MNVPPSIRVMSWNIHGAVGADRRCDPDRILDLVRRQAPDILALQEVDGRAHLGRREEAFEVFAEGLGPHVAEARLVRRPRRDYGHLLWSRWPIERHAVRLLPGGRFEPRAAIDAAVSTPQGALRVLSVHFGLLPGDRRRQAEALAAWSGEGDLTTIVLGDVNEWASAGPVHARLSRVLPTHLLRRTFPAFRPVARMDRLYASGGIEIAALPTLDAEARRASDHLPVTADIRLPPAGPGQALGV